MNNIKIFKFTIIILILTNILYYYSNQVIVSQNKNLVLFSGSKFETMSNEKEIKILYYPSYNIQCKDNKEDNKFNYSKVLESLSYKINIDNGFIIIDNNCEYGYLGVNNKQIVMDIVRILSSILCIIILFIL